MCKASPYPRCSNHARKALDAALRSGNTDRVKLAKQQFYTSVEGIQQLRDSGREELADKYAMRRNRLIAEAKKIERLKKRPIRLGLDIDNTIGDFNKGMLTRIMLEKGYTVEQAEALYPTPTDYSFVVSGWFPNVNSFKETFNNAEKNGVYRTMDVYPEAAKIIRQLAASGDVEIHLVSARNKKWNDDTRAWLRAHRIPFKSITFTDAKEETDMDIYLDDAGYQLAKLKEHGKKVIAFDQLYNRSLSDIPRVKHWTQVPAMITRTVKVV